MIVVGLTGGIGSGKSSVSEIFEGLGVKVVDADVASRQPVMKGQPALKKIAEKFGSNILTSAGELDRRKLREIIFKESSAKDWLENLLHPLIHQILIDDLATASSKYAILVSPLLFETNQKDLCSKTISVWQSLVCCLVTSLKSSLVAISEFSLNPDDSDSLWLVTESL